MKDSGASIEQTVSWTTMDAPLKKVELHSGDRVQLTATRVGKGVEVTRNPELNGWIYPNILREWCDMVKQMAAQINQDYRYD